jgi:hypothetical protein
MAAITISDVQRYALDRDDDLWLITATTASIAAAGGHIQAADIGVTSILDVLSVNELTGPSAATATASTATVTFADAGSADDTITIDGIIYTLKASPSAGYEVDVGADKTTTGANLAAAINRTGTPGTEYGAPTLQHPAVSAAAALGVVTLTARVPGDQGDNITLAASAATVSGALFTGGAVTRDFATGTITLGDAGSADETFTIEGVAYTLKATPAAAYEVDIAATAALTAANLAAAINRSGTPSATTYDAGTTAHPAVSASVSGAIVTLTARNPGSAGNDITMAASGTVTLSGSKLSGAAGAGRAANGTVQLDDAGSAAETFTIAGIVYTLAATPSAAYEVDIAASAALTAANLTAAINRSGTPGATTYHAGTAAHPLVKASLSGAVITVTALTEGTAGNSLGLAATGTVTLSGATLTDGVEPNFLEAGLAGSSGAVALPNSQTDSTAEANAGDIFVKHGSPNNQALRVAVLANRS